MSFAPSSSNNVTAPQAGDKRKQHDDNVKEYFPEVPVITYKGPDSTDPMSFRYYNADELIMGKPMKVLP
jgi:xylose isomerase